MRENRLSGSEGLGAELNRLSLPLSGALCGTESRFRLGRVIHKRTETLR